MNLNHPAKFKPNRYTFLRRCFICRDVSEAGWHPSCIANSCKDTALHKFEPMNLKECPGCPYRKGKTTWMDRGRLALNLLRIKHNAIQCCHETPASEGEVKACTGAILCIRFNGTTQINSPDEMRALEPAKSNAEYLERYKGTRK